MFPDDNHRMTERDRHRLSPNGVDGDRVRAADARPTSRSRSVRPSVPLAGKILADRRDGVERAEGSESADTRWPRLNAVLRRGGISPSKAGARRSMLRSRSYEAMTDLRDLDRLWRAPAAIRVGPAATRGSLSSSCSTTRKAPSARYFNGDGALGILPLRNGRRGQPIAAHASHVDGEPLRIRLARRFLAPETAVGRLTRRAVDRVRRGPRRWSANPGRRRRRCSPSNWESRQPRLSLDRQPAPLPEDVEREHIAKRAMEIHTRAHRGRARSAGIRAAPVAQHRAPRRAKRAVFVYDADSAMPTTSHTMRHAPWPLSASRALHPRHPRYAVRRAHRASTSGDQFFALSA